jgi:hypothetical protein
MRKILAFAAAVAVTLLAVPGVARAAEVAAQVASACCCCGGC